MEDASLACGQASIRGRNQCKAQSIAVENKMSSEFWVPCFGLEYKLVLG